MNDQDLKQFWKGRVETSRTQDYGNSEPGSSFPANSIQIGGTHYKNLTIQVWDFIAANGIGFFEGTAIKYLARWREKGGVEDLRKARHYIDKIIEIETK
jgi:hypothetical protein